MSHSQPSNTSNAAALVLLMDLRSNGFALKLDSRGRLWVTPRKRLTDTDRGNIRRQTKGLIALIGEELPAVSPATAWFVGLTPLQKNVAMTWVECSRQIHGGTAEDAWERALDVLGNRWLHPPTPPQGWSVPPEITAELRQANNEPLHQGNRSGRKNSNG